MVHNLAATALIRAWYSSGVPSQCSGGMCSNVTLLPPGAGS
jgi:hypothetical protein